MNLTEFCYLKFQLTPVIVGKRSAQETVNVSVMVTEPIIANVNAAGQVKNVMMVSNVWLKVYRNYWIK